jgi:L,D-transpeptidase YcbB
MLMSRNRMTSTRRRGARLDRAKLAGCVAVLASCIGSATLSVVAADEGNTTWVRFPGQGTYETTADQPYDKQFMKEWESAPPKGFPTLSPENINAMKAAIKRYEDIVAQGGWPTLPEETIRAGAFNPAVGPLRQRLIASGDMAAAAGAEGGYDYNVEKAIKRFQASNGLTPTGIADKRTVAALNVPAALRLRQLKTNLGRVTELARGAGKKYVVVNIPAAQIEAVDGDKVVSRHAGVVGKLDRQTPILKSAIHQLNFNPVWHLPPTVISQDLAPKGADMSRRGQDVLAKFGIEAYTADGRKVETSKVNWSSGAANQYSFRQQPGPENPLGFVKINFNNSHSVYMHDTPSQTLFGRNFRSASSGCVRIAGIEQLSAWLVAEQGWSVERVMQMKKSGERLDVNLKKPIPLYFAYITAWATEDGVIQFRRDLYNKDGVGPVASAY